MPIVPSNVRVRMDRRVIRRMESAYVHLDSLVLDVRNRVEREDGERTVRRNVIVSIKLIVIV